MLEFAYMTCSENQKQECETKENELVKEYEKIHGHAPAGNIAKTNSYGPTDEAKTIYDGLFE